MTDESSLRLLVLADLHYASTPEEYETAPTSRLCTLGLELAERAIDDANRRGGFDAVAIMGDLLNDGTKAGAEQSLAELREAIFSAVGDKPIIIVPGNHDGDAARLFDTFDDKPGLHELSAPDGQKYRFFSIADKYGEGDEAQRSEEDRKNLIELGKCEGGPIVVLQHNPMNPPIESTYPHMLINREQVMADYTAAGVMLSISGHFHAGQDETCVDGVKYYTATALAESPHQYSMVTLRGDEVTIEQRRLITDIQAELVDYHIHTEFSYCGTDVTATEAIERAKTFALGGMSIAEHAPQLYCCHDDYWNGRHIANPSLWRSSEHSRMGEFRQKILPMRSEFVRVGMEVEVDSDGVITLLDEDRDGIDIILGGVHWLTGPNDKDLSDVEMISTFMKVNEHMLAAGVDILAHPWRYFRRSQKPAPKELYPVLADMLAATGVAAEINFHTNQPDPAFFACCIERGVKISFGSDAHRNNEVGNFAAHLEVLRTAAGTDDLDGLLYR